MSLRVGEIRLQMEDIFSDDEVREATGVNRLLRRTMNRLHTDTKPWVVSKELLFETGEVLSPYLLAESERNLRGLGFLSRIAVVPSDTTADGRVNVDVRTYETWTLALGLNFALAADGALRWDASLGDKNFLGYGFETRVAVGDDLDASYGRLYFNMNRVLHSPLSIRANYDSRSDGYSRSFAVSLPYRAEDQIWSANIRAWDQSFDVRWYLSNGGPSGDDPTASDRLYVLLPRNRSGMQLDVMRRLGAATGDRIWRAGLGLRIDDRSYEMTGSSYELSDGRRHDVSYLGTPGSILNRDSGTTVWPFLAVASRGRRWAETRFLHRFGVQEDIPLAPSFLVTLGPSSPSLGSTTGDDLRAVTEFDLRNWDQWGRSFWFQQIDGHAVLGSAADRNHRLNVVLGSYVRLGAGNRSLMLKTFVEGVHSEGLRGDQIPALGLDHGLRTLGLDGMAGDRLLRWSTEVGRKIDWAPLDMANLGWGAFYGGGVATWRDEDRDLSDARHEAGIGLRVGFSRSSRAPLVRLDLARDLSDDDGWVVTTVTSGFF